MSWLFHTKKSKAIPPSDADRIIEMLVEVSSILETIRDLLERITEKLEEKK